MTNDQQTAPNLLSCIGLAAALLCVCSCRSVEETHNPVSHVLVKIGATAPAEVENTSQELSRIQFDDIPVPPGFFFRNHRNESYSFVDGDLRQGRFVYWGRSFASDTRREYLELLAKDPYNWSPVSVFENDEAGPWIFEKNGERCVVESRRFFHDARNGDVVTIAVGKHLKYDDENPRDE
ncbi:MAG: hypothetical protein ACI97A_000015 [Planctomycetota bacterium]|jgi:hypothetical protein